MWPASKQHRSSETFGPRDSDGATRLIDAPPLPADRTPNDRRVRPEELRLRAAGLMSVLVCPGSATSGCLIRPCRLGVLDVHILDRGEASRSSCEDAGDCGTPRGIRTWPRPTRPRSIASGFAWSTVECCGNCGELVGVPAGQVGALREVLTRALVRAALARAVRVGDEHRDASLDGERCVGGELLAAVPGERAVQLGWQCR